jgi:hypothetical protein
MQKVCWFRSRTPNCTIGKFRGGIGGTEFKGVEGVTKGGGSPYILTDIRTKRIICGFIMGIFTRCDKVATWSRSYQYSSSSSSSPSSSPDNLSKKANY